MSKPNPDVEIVNPPNMLQIKIGGPISAGDLHLIEKAEDAIKDLRHEFGNWLEEEVQKLEDAAKAVREKGLKGDEGEQLFIRAHDLRGVGFTYEFPIITRLAASLTKLIDMDEKRQQASKALALAHVNAIRAALSQNIRDTNDAVAAALAEELEVQSSEFAKPWDTD
ncbi:MAG: Hpt domain-containing protein [Maricaulis sp.]|jgi:chemotaxis protein histidine kinase CheA|uniref:Hpt domain-containing protein n=1 Tax=Maricaulis sp. TaxID=1486257 RepID=UPI001B07277E|nr:Hpt domain-containing protein [Maricaulis sp.]MBO6728509.1 Hpt domain-containing protein [Maricaulis sp.]MBO6848482.1 Hpt domain-containing protein [Maricaulis sp.]MBO6877247.1 Hpt domain-containing protein [Maricaulis sp.]MDM7985575.1 Hpt domain-containing protein [Maricaulis sp.]